MCTFPKSDEFCILRGGKLDRRKDMWGLTMRTSASGLLE